MPSLCSSRSTSMPGVPFSTTNDLIAARPRSLSSVAQTTTPSARSPEVTKIFSPLRTYSSPSLTAVVRIWAESEPNSGSVIAIAGPGALEPLELLVVGDRGDRGVAEALARHREQQADVAPAHLHDREHRGEVGAVLARCVSPSSSSRRTPVAPAPSLAPDSERPSIIAASMSSSLGYSCSARSYLREIGRSMFIATWWAWSTSGRNFLGSSRLIIRPARPFHQADGSQVAVPPLHRVLLDEAVAAEQLDAVEADLHALARRTAGGPGRPRGRSPCPAAARPAAL